MTFDPTDEPDKAPPSTAPEHSFAIAGTARSPLVPPPTKAKQAGPVSGRGRRGASLIEFAVVAPLVVAIIFGIIELGRGLMVVHLLNNAAQAGCRIGIIEGKTGNDIQTAVNQILANAGINGDSVQVQVNDLPATSSAVGAAPAGAEVTVVVQIPAGQVTWLPGGTNLVGTLQGKFTMRRE